MQVMRKINALITRARLCKVHAYIMNHIKSQLPSSKKKVAAKQVVFPVELHLHITSEMKYRGGRLLRSYFSR